MTLAPSLPQLLTPLEVASCLRIDRRKVYALRNQRRLHAIPLYSDEAQKRPPLRFLASAVADYLGKCGAGCEALPPSQAELEREAELEKARLSLLRRQHQK